MKGLIAAFLLFVSTTAHADSFAFECRVTKIVDADEVMYFEIEKGSAIKVSARPSNSRIVVGSLGYSGKEVMARTNGEYHKVSFKDPEMGAWSFSIHKSTGRAYLRNSSFQAKAFAVCAAR